MQKRTKCNINWQIEPEAENQTETKTEPETIPKRTISNQRSPRTKEASVRQTDGQIVSQTDR